MNSRSAMLSLLHLFVSLFFFAGATFFFSLPFLPQVRLKISDILLANPSLCHLAGAFFMAAAIVLIGGFYLLSRGRYLHISMGGNPISIDSAAVYKTVEECLKHHFGPQISFSDLSIARGGKLEIEVSLAPSDEPIREELIADLQKHLVPLLEEKFGYSKTFGLVVETPNSGIRNS